MPPNTVAGPDSAEQQLLLRIRLYDWRGYATAELRHTANHRSFWTFGESVDQRLMPT
jgi:hypothetical protein